MNNKQSIRRHIALGAIAVTALALTATNTLAAPSETRPPKPTVVLVHGAFADASTWNGVIDRLQRDGYLVIAPPCASWPSARTATRPRSTRRISG